MELSQTEIEDFDAPVFGEKDVFRLEITMDDSSIMSGCQPMGNVDTHIDGFVQAHLGTLQTLAQRFALEQLGHYVG
jgi:hypothetical protein